MNLAKRYHEHQKKSISLVSKRLLLLSLFILAFIFSNNTVIAQKVYSCSSKHDAEVKVFVAKSKYDAHLVVYKCSSKYDATDNKGLWFFCDSKYDADKKVFFVDSKHDADLIIYFSDSKYDAQWRDSGKKQLMY
jgi:hypothetical protein